MSLAEDVLRPTRLLGAAVQLLLVASAYYLAFWLRFEGEIPRVQQTLLLSTLPWLVVIRAVSFVPFRLYGGLWRYTGLSDLVAIVMAVTSSSVIFALVAPAVRGWGYPYSVLLVDAVLLIGALSAIRLAKRVSRQLRRRKGAKRVLVIGAGDAGEMIIRDMKNQSRGYEPVGLIDDDPGKAGQRIHGVPVLGGRGVLDDVMQRMQPHEVLIAMPSAHPTPVRELTALLRRFKVPITTLPGLRDLMGGRVGVHQIRQLTVQDLLTRAPIDLNAGPVRQLIGGARVLVTGAGGSIGGELSRQIAALGPAALVLLDRYENTLHDLQHDLAGVEGIHAVIGDVTDRARVRQVMKRFRPDIVFHAAAHKHVPLMEDNPGEAIKNNVLGTATVAEAAVAAGVARFILISTDKAVNPSSVMGATKRIAEQIVEAMTPRSATRLMTVRFGNVLGSNGSVLPRFLAQIKNGGPVTVTHPDVRRYFMLIPEAVQLVLHAAALAQSGATFVR